jgi:hypothetical protein
MEIKEKKEKKKKVISAKLVVSKPQVSPRDGGVVEMILTPPRKPPCGGQLPFHTSLEWCSQNLYVDM